MLIDHGFNSLPVHFHIMTLAKLFTHLTSNVLVKLRLCLLAEQVTTGWVESVEAQFMTSHLWTDCLETMISSDSVV